MFFVLVGFVTLFVIPLSDRISVSLLSDARTRMGLLLLLPCAFFTGIENICKNYFYGVREVRPPAITEVVEQLLRTFFVLAFLVVLRPSYMEWTVGVIVIGMVFCEIVSSSMLGIFYLRHIKKTPDQGRLPSSRALLGEMAGITAPIAASTLAANLLGSVNTIVIPGRLMVSGMGQSEALSAYGVAFGMTLPLTALPSVFVIPLSLTLMPRIAHSLALGDHAALQSHVRKTLRLAAVLVLPACLLLIPFGPIITRALFAEEQAGRYVGVLAITEIFSCFQYLMNSLLNGMGKQRLAAFNVLLTDAAQLAATWYLVAVPELRLTGFVAAFAFSTALCAVLNLCAVARCAGISLSPEKWLFGPLFAALTATGGAYAALGWLTRWGFSERPAALCALIFAAGVYCLLCRLNRVR
jgi:O-antigen/teichoic acid export membrane protein